MRTAFHGEVDTADANAAPVAFTLYKEGEVVAYSLGAHEYVRVTDYSYSPEVAMVVKIVGATDAAGTRMVDRWCAATGGADRALNTPFIFPEGVTPRLYGSVADHVKATIFGEIIGRQP